jgi:SHS2 domain-containing protein
VGINKLLPGVRSIDHAADIGIRIDAPDLESLFDRAARGMMALIRGEDEQGQPADRPAAGTGPAATPGARHPSSSTATDATPVSHRIARSADDAAMLLADWLRELLFEHETRALGQSVEACTGVTQRALQADVLLVPDTAAPVREIKGVTYHGLDAARVGAGWSAMVIFDV